MGLGCTLDRGISGGPILEQLEDHQAWRRDLNNIYTLNTFIAYPHSYYFVSLDVFSIPLSARAQYIRLSSEYYYPHNRLVSAAVSAYTVVGPRCRGFRPTASAPQRACTSTGAVPVGLHSFLQLATHLLNAGQVTDLPVGITAFSSLGLYDPSTMEIECGVELSLCPSGSCVPPLPWQNGVLRWAKGGLSMVFGICCFPSQMGLMFSCFANWLFTVGWGIF